MSTELDELFAEITPEIFEAVDAPYGTYVQSNTGSYNAETGVVEPPEGKSRYDNIRTRYVVDGAKRKFDNNGGLVYDRMVYIPGSSVDNPNVGDTILSTGETFRVTEVSAHYSGEDVAIYGLGCMRG